ncbi:TonB-dependent receptor [Tunicatimonas pelagia]|uniref:TonB-dependent receptor n=1 Tax=Tunicatimonas pelagia TaxID=931531 RepID=UPI002667168D|nr:TonB-dependent receptor [Tunicatimonas pelagia]WKN41389.1 TonB-dependent receptor [Tunicatimonas pelagia]
MNNSRTPSTKEKALALNLDRSIYGTLAEIGAGQETASNFFKVGGASGTIAKTISAYDMKFSDEIYGKIKRYVSEERLAGMLRHEMRLVRARLSEIAPTTKFFAFANTVETLNYHKTNQGHGWLGLRFQCEPQGGMNECIIHVLLHDNEASLQQQAVGVLGVNLIYACTTMSDSQEMMLSLVDNIANDRIEIDFFRLTGPDFTSVDNRLMALKLVKHGLSRATMFDADGEVLQPQEALYKKNVMILRGRFRPVTHVNMDMLHAGLQAFRETEPIEEENLIRISELTLHSLTDDAKIDDNDFLHRVDLLSSLGQKVMISDYQRYYSLASYISKVTRGKIAIVLGIKSLQQLFDEDYYRDLSGGILEAFGTLFKRNIRLYVYPACHAETQELLCIDDLKLPGQLTKLYQYLCETSRIVDVQPTSKDNLSIYSDDVLAMIRSGQTGWEKMVPPEVSEAIKTKELFDYQEAK